MKKFVRFACVFAVLLGFLAITSQKAALAQEVVAPEFVEGELLVKVSGPLSPDNVNIARLNGELGSTTIGYFDSIGVVHVQLPAGESLTNALDTASKLPYVEYAQRNNVYVLANTPNDPDYGSLWGMNQVNDIDIDAPEAWDITTGSSSVVVGVIDSGVDYNHVDLAGNMWTNPGEIAGNGVDDDANGFVDDVYGWDFVNNDSNPAPAGGSCGGHGTHVAGTIGAVGNNNTGVVGVNWNVNIAALKVFEDLFGFFCTTSDSALVGAIQYSGDMGIPVTNNSWGGGSASAAIENAIDAAGNLFVAAAGNGGADGVGDNNDTTPNYPSNYPLANILAVAASQSDGTRASFSNFGSTTVDLAAPGAAILSTLPGNTYGSYSGTSMATPHVAGAAALLLSADPTLSVADLKQLLMDGTDPSPIQTVTNGHLNVFNSLQLMGSGGATVIAGTTPLNGTTPAPGDTIDWESSLTNTGGSATSADITIKLVRAGKPDIILAGPKTVSLNAGETKARTMSFTVPATASGGLTFSIVTEVVSGSVTDTASVDYTITP